ncbi:MAG TPA: immunoglobulin domain-containing protein [Fibrobacteria bacterium]|nr:immunoglobulin domain-containing protein [Fibrobacteria bacterium]
MTFGLGGCLTDDKGKESDGPTISVSPSDLIVSQGAVATFSVTASGSGTLEYQWQRNGVNMEGRTAAMLSFVANDSDDNAEYRCRVKDKSGTTYSDVAHLRIRVQSEDVTLGAQNSLLPSSIDLDTWTTYTASTSQNNSNLIDLVFAFSTSTGNDSLALYSPSVAKNGIGSSAGFDFMQSWPTANDISIRKVEVANWNDVMTDADIKNLYDNGSAGSTAGRVFVKAGTTVVAKSNEGLYVLLRVTSVTAQSANGSGSIDAKAKW